MEQKLLEGMLAKGMSAQQIGRQVGKGTNTVYYWIDKYGLKATHSTRHSYRGGISREVLLEGVESGKSIAEIAIEVGLSKGTVRHWLRTYGLATSGPGGRYRKR